MPLELGPSRVTPGRWAVAEHAQCVQPLAATGMPGVNHQQNVQPTGHEHLKDLREGEQVGANDMDVLPGTRDVELMGLHGGSRLLWSTKARVASVGSGRPSVIARRRGASRSRASGPVPAPAIAPTSVS